MTVINMLSLGEEGVAVADEQASGGIRKYNIAQKLYRLNGSTVYGGAGPADAIRTVYELSDEKIKEEEKERSLRQVHELVTEVIIQAKNTLKDKVLRSNLGIGLDNLLTGTLGRTGMPLDPQVKERAEELLKRFDGMDLGVLLGGLENNRFCIYLLNDEGTGRKIYRHFQEKKENLLILERDFAKL
jgi:hypothetical protein